MNRRYSLLHVCSIVLAIAGTAGAVPSFTGNYTQDFNGMGTGTAAPDGWAAYAISGSHDQFKPVDDPSGTGAPPTGSDIKGGTANATLIVATPDTTTTQKSAQGYNWAVGGSSAERSLGTSPTGNAGMVLQLTLTNGTSSPISNVSISYDIRRLGTTTNNNNYNNPPYVGVEELPGYWLFYSVDNGATYNNIASVTPNITTCPNGLGTTPESVVGYTLSGTWNAGGNLMLRWFDDNAQGPSPDQRLGLDNVNITPEPVTVALLALGGVGFIRRRGN